MTARGPQAGDAGSAPRRGLLRRGCRALEARAGWIAGAAAVTAFGVGLLYSARLGPELRYHDEEEYLHLARGLVDLGRYTLDGTTPTAFRPPGYPAFLSLGLALGAGAQALRMVQQLLLAASIVILYRLVAREAGRLAGAIAALLALVYPIFLYAAGTLYPQTLGSTLLLLGILLAAPAPRPPGVPRAAAAGLVFGLLVLCIPIFVFSLCLVAVWLLFTYRSRALRPCTAGLAVALVVVGGWQLRNLRVLGAPVFVSTNSGVNLLLGNSENATADSGTNADISPYTSAAEGLAEVERDRFFRRSAVTWIVENPGKAARLYLAKVLHYFGYRDQLATRSEASPARELLMLVSYGPLLLLVLARLACFRRWPLGSQERLLVALFLANALFMALFFPRLRFRIPLDYLLIAIAAGFAARLLQRVVAPDPR